MNTLLLDSPKPLMIAHRGLSGIEMENTCSAFVAAGNRSYYGIETDVHVTTDGRYIVIHDDTTGRVALDDLRVEESTYETLRSLRLADRDGRRGRRDLMLPSLSEYMEICKKYEKQSVLELKNPMEPEHIEKIVQCVRDAGWLAHTTFISFSLENMLYIRRLLPDQKAQFLIEGQPDWENVKRILAENRLDLDIDYQLLTEKRVKEIHDLGREVNVWTVNSLADARRLRDYGVDYITTNIIE